MTLIEPRTLAQHVDNNLFMQRVPARMLSVLGPLALALSAIGLYAVLAYALAQRTREIAVRLTLGATPRSVVWFMIWQHMRVVVISAGVGLVAAFGAQPRGRLIARRRRASAIRLSLSACRCCSWRSQFSPAGCRHAARRVDPMTALRAE